MWSPDCLPTSFCGQAWIIQITHIQYLSLIDACRLAGGPHCGFRRRRLLARNGMIWPVWPRQSGRPSAPRHAVHSRTPLIQLDSKLKQYKMGPEQASACKGAEGEYPNPRVVPPAEPKFF